MGETVDFPSNGHSGSGYLATPNGGPGPGVVVCQEWWGLLPQIEGVCDRLAAQGFSALAVDLYHGDAASLREPDEAQKLAMALNIDTAARELSGAVTYLLGSGRAEGAAVGTVGFCMGGGLAMYLASLRPEVTATVTYYGVVRWEQAQPRVDRITGPVLGHYGTADHSNPREKVEDLESRLRAAGVAVEFHWYEGADHAFFNEERPEVFDAAAAQLSWDRTLAFFRTHLKNDR
ncbi:MAG: dienelactone hydrolase family protein [Candidatus Dormibacteria bacterium]